MTNRARRLTLLLLAVLVVAFAATWLTLPNTGGRVGYPARAFAVGLLVESTEGSCIGGGCTPGSRVRSTGRIDAIRRSEIPTLERRVKVIFGAAAAVVVLAGLALGAGRRAPRGGSSNPPR